MADALDRAAEHEEFMRAEAFKASIKPPKPIAATGQCLFCETTLPPPRRWCDAECRDLWQGNARNDN